MGRRTGKNPTADDSFVWRICHALDITPKELAKELGVGYKAEIEPLLTGNRGQLVEIDRDDTWWKIYEVIGRRISHMLAVRHELDKKLQADRVERFKRTEQFRRYHDGKSTD